MTLGDGIVTATILVLMAIALYLISKHRKWLLTSKLMAIPLSLALLFSLGIFGFQFLENRPYRATSFANLDLGITPADAKIILGAPASEEFFEEEKTLVYYYTAEYSDGTKLILVFEENEDDGSALKLICDTAAPKLFGLSSYSSMSKVIKHLGAPTSESINNDELSKMLFYDNWNARFLIEKNRVSGICIGEHNSNGASAP